MLGKRKDGMFRTGEIRLSVLKEKGSGLEAEKERSGLSTPGLFTFEGQEAVRVTRKGVSGASEERRIGWS